MTIQELLRAEIEAQQAVGEGDRHSRWVLETAADRIDYLERAMIVMAESSNEWGRDYANAALAGTINQ